MAATTTSARPRVRHSLAPLALCAQRTHGQGASDRARLTFASQSCTSCAQHNTTQHNTHAPRTRTPASRSGQGASLHYGARLRGGERLRARASRPLRCQRSAAMFSSRPTQILLMMPQHSPPAPSVGSYILNPRSQASYSPMPYTRYAFIACACRFRERVQLRDVVGTPRSRRRR